MSLTIDLESIKKFDKPGPRYTSYPTAPSWSSAVNDSTYIEKLKIFGQTDKTLSMYVHIPFCQSMCTFCACSVIIRQQDEKYGNEYLNYLFKEIDLIADTIGTRKIIKQLHWGGGTPTFLNDAQIENLYKKIDERFDIDPDSEIAIEIDPRTIHKTKIEKLKRLGFNRISMGVQDFDLAVQESINRIQSFTLVKEIYDWCRKLRFKSVNFDLIYGLPKQTLESFHDTVRKVINLRPDRIALYSFAYVPWLKKHQKKIEKTSLPANDAKLDIFLDARQQFEERGYQAIAMDHFALQNDELVKAFKAGKLYRNFMGYTVKPADEFIGIGVTSIGYLENTFFQNKKTLKEYYGDLKDNQLPIARGLRLSFDDLIRQWIIHSLMCHFKIEKAELKRNFNIIFDEYFAEEQKHIRTCINDDLLIQTDYGYEVSECGKIFIRNICMGFDAYLQHDVQKPQFSQTV